MNLLKLFLTVSLISVVTLARATSDAGDEPKNIAKCGVYDLFQYKHVTLFQGIIHKEHRYQIVNNISKETMNVEFQSHSEGATLKATEIYEHNPTTGAASKYRKLSIVSWNDLFYIELLENTGAKSKVNCIALP